MRGNATIPDRGPALVHIGAHHEMGPSLTGMVAPSRSLYTFLPLALPSMPICPHCHTPRRVDREGYFRLHGEGGVVCDGTGEQADVYREVQTRDAIERRQRRQGVPQSVIRSLEHVKRDGDGRRLL